MPAKNSNMLPQRPDDPPEPARPAAPVRSLHTLTGRSSKPNRRTPHTTRRLFTLLAAPITVPSLSGCTPAVPGGALGDAIVGLLAGKGTMRFDGTINPVLVAP